MESANEQGALPRRAIMRWLVDTKGDVPASIRESLAAGLFGTLPVFVAGVINTMAVAMAIAARIQTWPFFLWLGIELLLALARIPVLIAGRRALARGTRCPTDLALLLALLWASSVGYGSFLCLVSGDWVASTLACVSAGAMVGGICFRNFGAPRLCAAMILLSLGPCAAGGIVSGQPILLVAALQIPLYIVSMTMAAYRLHAMMVRTMRAEQENGHRARHDALTGLLNRSGLDRALQARTPAGEPTPITFFYVDLDGFKAVNDTFGHGVGDRLLASVAERLRAAVRPSDIVARIGGDEFLIVANHRDRASAHRTGERIVRELSHQPYLIGEDAALIGACIGIAMGPEHGSDFDSLIAAADAALYLAKARGGARCTIAAPPVPPLKLAVNA